MNAKEALDDIVNVVEKIKKTDDDIIRITENLKIVLLNLTIENARIKGNTGIKPITEALSRNISSIEDGLKNLIIDNRAKFTEATKVLYGYIDKMN